VDYAILTKLSFVKQYAFVDNYSLVTEVSWAVLNGTDMGRVIRSTRRQKLAERLLTVNVKIDRKPHGTGYLTKGGNYVPSSRKASAKGSC
jgi:hypothetical protein